jgi:hypothetical protein
MRKLLYIVCACLLLSCSKQSHFTIPTVEGKVTITESQVEQVMRQSSVVGLFGHLVSDTQYIVPSEDWVRNKFPDLLLNFQKELKITSYIEESNDCDDFAKMAASFARMANSNTPSSKKYGITVGEFIYRPDGLDQRYHAINIIVAYTKENKLQVLFFDATTMQFKTLSKDEINSCNFWIF